jgi:hypothetical protein
MEFASALVAFLFMLFFLSTIRAFINKDDKHIAILTVFTSVIFAGLFWVCIDIFST